MANFGTKPTGGGGNATPLPESTNQSTTLAAVGRTSNDGKIANLQKKISELEAMIKSLYDSFVDHATAEGYYGSENEAGNDFYNLVADMRKFLRGNTQSFPGHIVDGTLLGYIRAAANAMDEILDLKNQIKDLENDQNSGSAAGNSTEPSYYNVLLKDGSVVSIRIDENTIPAAVEYYNTESEQWVPFYAAVGLSQSQILGTFIYIGATLIPWIGEFDDAYTIYSPNSTELDRFVARITGIAGALSFGLSPNSGAFKGLKKLFSFDGSGISKPNKLPDELPGGGSGSKGFGDAKEPNLPPGKKIGDGNGGFFENEWDHLEDAIGDSSITGVRILETRDTTNANIYDSGYITAYRVEHSNGEIWTVFYNPTTKKYGGEHLSSDQLN